MSSPLSDHRIYFDAVQNYFLERTGRGLVLSSRDLELLLSWRRHGASAAIVCQGIDDAVETLQNAPRDLHACKKYVEPRLEEVATIVRPSVMYAPPAAPRVEDDSRENIYVQRLVAAQNSTTCGTFDKVYADLCPRLEQDLAESDDPISTAYAYDDLLVDEAYRVLATDERLRIDAEIEGRYGAHLAMMPQQGREETVRASRRDILQRSFGLVGLIEG